MPDDDLKGDPIKAALTRLLAQRERIDKAIAGLQGLDEDDVLQNTGISGLEANTGPVDVQPGVFLGKSIAEAGKQLLAMRKKPLSNLDIASSLSDGGIVFSGGSASNVVASVMHRESQKPDGEVVRVGRGLWGLASWYANAGRFRRGASSDN